MSLLDDNGSHGGCDHTVGFGETLRSGRIDTRSAEQAADIYRHVSDQFEPRDGMTLLRSLSASSIAHVLIALPLFFYGSVLALNPIPEPEKSVGPKPIAAKFVFEKKAAPEPPPVAKAETPPAPPVEKKIEKKPKAIKRAVKRVRKTAPKKSRPPVEEPTPIPEEAPTYVAPAALAAKGPVVQPPVAPDTSLPSGPGVTAPAEEPSEVAESQFDIKGATRAYIRSLSRAVKKNYAYPRAARRGGLMGRAVVQLLVDANGNILSVALATSSGHDILDQAALKHARSIKSLPAPPREIQWGEQHIRVPFRFAT